MNTSTPRHFTKNKRMILMIVTACAALTGCAYLLSRFIAPEEQPVAESAYQSIQERQAAPSRLIERTESPLNAYVTMEIIHDDVVTRTAPSKARQLFMELQAIPNFQKALENPQARANIERMLNHPEIEKKLNGWFASLVRSAIHDRVKEPDFPEAIAQKEYVDNLFKQYGVA